MAKKTPIGEKIFSLRKAMELTQGALGEKIGVSRAAISQFELGETLPSPTTLTKLSQALAFDLAEIWQASPNPSTAEDEHRLLPFFPLAAYPSLVSFVDPTMQNVLHTVLARVPVLRLPRVDYEGAAVVEVQGDSMAPRYPHGSRYLIHPALEDLRFATGVYFFIFHRKSVLIRRIIANNGKTITLRADATGEEVSYTLSELRKLRDDRQCFIRKLGQAVHLPPEQ